MAAVGVAWHGDGRQRVLMWALVAAVVANAAIFVRAVAWPLIASDNWNHVHPLLRDLAAGELGLANFFVQRAGVDHAQPLMKLVMAVNARWFGLDFMLEGLLGIAFAVVALVLLYRLAVADAPAAPRPPAFHVGFVAVAAGLLSLHNTLIYIYPMVTMWFALYALALLMALAAWRALPGGRRWPLALAAFVLGVVADDSAFLYCAALGLALLLHGARERTLRHALWLLLPIAIGLLASRIVYGLYGTTSGTTLAIFNRPLPERLASLAALWREAWHWFAIPASSGLLGEESLRTTAGAHAATVRNLLAALLLVGHGWFWWSALRLRPGSTWFAAVLLMLMFYAHVAAILMVRVSALGTAYLDQPRYVSFYQFGIAALLLMAMAHAAGAPAVRARRALAVAAGAVLALQFALSGHARDQQPGIQGSHVRMAMDLAHVARDPAGPVPADCFPGMDICVLPPERRVELVRVLRESRLQLFSDQYLRRHPAQREAAEYARGP